MAVLIEGISIVIRGASIARLYEGGSARFLAEVPNGTLCADGELARVGFTNPNDTKAYVDRLVSRGLTYRVDDGPAIDMVVIDQQSGFLASCDWAVIGNTLWENEPSCPILVCLATNTRVGEVVVPQNWKFAGSLSDKHVFASTESMGQSFRMISSENGVETYVDTRTGERRYLRRS